MFQKFFTDTLQSKFIKGLLRNTPIPRLDVVSAGDYLIKGCRYIYQFNIIECTKSGIIELDIQEETTGITVICSEFITVSEDLFVTDTVKPTVVRAEYRVVVPFVMGQINELVTENYVSKYSYYDPETHRYLGELLRCIRGLWGIDMMPFYNCFNYTVLSDIYLNDTGYHLQSNSAYKVIAVPIKFNRTYSIALDCDSTVYMMPVCYGKLGLVKVSASSSGVFTGQYVTDNLSLGVSKYSSVRFNHPVSICVENTSDDEDLNSNSKAVELQRLEKYLYLLIQLPVQNDSSVVVTEGEYISVPTVINCEYIDKMSDYELNRSLISSRALTRLNTHENYAFSDTLIQYLLLSVICSQDSISDNVKRVQDKAEKLKLVFPYTDSEKTVSCSIDVDNVYGVWSRYLRYFLFKYAENSSYIEHTDINGLVTKNIEKLLLKG